MKNREEIQLRKHMLIAKSEIYRHTLVIEFARIKTATLGPPKIANWIRALSPTVVGTGIVAFLLFGKKFRSLRWLASKLYWIHPAMRLTNSLLKFISHIRKRQL